MLRASRRGCPIKEYNHISVSAYPRALFPDSYCAQTGPSEGASRGVVKRGGERWPRTGATRAPNARRLKLHRRGVTGLFGGSAVTPCQTTRHCPGPKRWLETSATGGLAEQSLKHRARDAGEKADLRAFSGISRGSVGPRGVPRALELFSSAHRPNDSGCKAHRENDGGCLKIKSWIRAQKTQRGPKRVALRAASASSSVSARTAPAAE